MLKPSPRLGLAFGSLVIAAGLAYLMLERGSVERATPIPREAPAPSLSESISGDSQEEEREEEPRPRRPANVDSESKEGGAPPQSEESQAPVRWARRDLSELSRSNLEARQPTLQEGYGYIDGSEDLVRVESYAHKAVSMCKYAIMVIMDADGTSSPLPDWLTFDQYESTELYLAAVREYRASQEPKVEGSITVSSNRTEYVIDRARFPVYFQLQELLKMHPAGVPLEDVPLKDVQELMDLALSYRLP